MDLGQQRSEAGMLYGLARGEAHRPVGAAVEGSLERDQRRPPRGVAHELDGSVHRLRSGVRQKHALLARPWRQGREPLAQRRHSFIVEIRAADMEEPVGGVLYRGDHLRMTVTGGGNGDARHEVEVTVPVHVLNHGTCSTRHDERVFLDVAPGRPLGIPGHHVASFGAGRTHHDSGIVTHTGRSAVWAPRLL